MNKPLATILDDDVDFTLALKRLLEANGFEVRTFLEIDKFFSDIQTHKRPDICFVDLNIKQRGDGISVIENLRINEGLTGPIFVISSVSDTKVFLYALKKGASDFLVKPIGRHILMNKLSYFLKAQQLNAGSPSLLPIACIGEKANLQVDLEIINIDELGITLTGNHTFPKDFVLSMKGAIFEGITGSLLPQNMTLKTAEYDPVIGKFKYYAIFDYKNPLLLTSVRRWILNQMRNGENLA